MFIVHVLALAALFPVSAFASNSHHTNVYVDLYQMPRAWDFELPPELVADAPVDLDAMPVGEDLALISDDAIGTELALTLQIGCVHIVYDGAELVVIRPDECLG